MTDVGLEGCRLRPLVVEDMGESEVASEVAHSQGESCWVHGDPGQDQRGDQGVHQELEGLLHRAGDRCSCDPEESSNSF